MPALNRSTNLSIRIVRDRPQQQKEELLWEEIQEGGEEISIQEEETVEIHVLKNYTYTDTEMETIKINKKEQRRSKETQKKTETEILSGTNKQRSRWRNKSRKYR